MNIVSVSGGSRCRLVRATAGSGGRRHEAAAAPAAGVARRARAGTLHWRMLRSRIPGVHIGGSGLPSSVGDSGRVALDGTTSRRSRAGPRGGPSPWLYVTVFDEGGSWHPSTCAASAITTKCMGSTSPGRASDADHPQWLVTDRAGCERQEGVVSLSYPEARRAFIDRRTSLIASTEFDGLFLCLRFHSRGRLTPRTSLGSTSPHGVTSASAMVSMRRDAFDIQDWRDLLGTYLTALMANCESHSPASASGCRSGAHAATCSVRRSATRRCHGATGCDSTSSIVW